MFKYKVNARVLAPLRVAAAVAGHQNGDVNNPSREQGTETEVYPLNKIVNASDSNANGVRLPIELFDPNDHEPVTYPIFANPKRGSTIKRKKTVIIGDSEASADGKESSSLQVKVLLDFGWFFGWLERLIWFTMLLGIIWSVAIDFSKATGEVCYINGEIEHYPFNILPSLSRTMSSFRVGTFLWTLSMAAAFSSRLLSNHFLHKLYDTWYENNWFNRIFLFLAYHLDNTEIISLLMIPAFSLDCDSESHRFFFIVFLGLTLLAEIGQYCTRFLRRKKNLLMSESQESDVRNYYCHIGILILCQLGFVGIMLVGYLLHDNLCKDFYYSIFTLGEYVTVIINIRFKRDTVLFVK